MKKITHPTITIGIPTYVSSESLVATVASIRAAILGQTVPVIVVVDGKQMPVGIKQQLKKQNVTVVQKQQRLGQSQRIGDLLRLSRSEITVLTNDDVVFDPGVLREISAAFKADRDLTLVGTRVTPLAAKSLIEHVLKFRNNLVEAIIPLWRDGKNYLAVNGRCLAVRTRFGRTLHLPAGVINNDAYIYLANQKKGGKFRYLAEAICYFRNPNAISGYTKQSQRFHISPSELSPYFGNIQSEFAIPLSIRVFSLLSVTMRNPVMAGLYLGLYVYTRYFQYVPGGQQFGIWETDFSTKRVSL